MLMYENHVVLVFLTRMLTTLAHLYKPVGGLKTYILLLPSRCGVEVAVWGYCQSHVVTVLAALTSLASGHYVGNFDAPTHIVMTSLSLSGVMFVNRPAATQSVSAVLCV